MKKHAIILYYNGKNYKHYKCEWILYECEKRYALLNNMNEILKFFLKLTLERHGFEIRLFLLNEMYIVRS